MLTTVLFSFDIDHLALFYLIDVSMSVDVHFTALFITPESNCTFKCGYTKLEYWIQSKVYQKSCYADNL